MASWLRSWSSGDEKRRPRPPIDRRTAKVQSRLNAAAFQSSWLCPMLNELIA